MVIVPVMDPIVRNPTNVASPLARGLSVTKTVVTIMTPVSKYQKTYFVRKRFMGK